MQHQDHPREQPMRLSSSKPTSFAEEMEQLASHPEGTLARMLHRMPVTNPEPEAGTLVLVRREVAGTSSPQIFLVRLVQERIGRMRDWWIVEVVMSNVASQQVGALCALDSREVRRSVPTTVDEVLTKAVG